MKYENKDENEDKGDVERSKRNKLEGGVTVAYGKTKTEQNKQ